MKLFFLKAWFLIATLLGTVEIGFALPICGGSPVKNWVETADWHNCQGKISGTNVVYQGAWKNGKRSGYGTLILNGSKYIGQFRNNDPHGVGTMESNGNKYVGEWKRTRFSGQGIYYHKDGNVQEGVWENNEFQYAKKTPYSRALISSSTLGVEFQKITKKQRVQIQLRLKDLGLYQLSIDGLYGKGTSVALKKYNKRNLDNADLKKLGNVTKLLNAVLEVVLPSKTITESAAIKFKQIKKEFGLSNYGGFLHSERLPNTLFFFSDIERNDSFEFRKALRNHDINLIVLSSPGGSVFEGLQIAGIIHDKKLKTYIAKNSFVGAGNCASACSFMFFAGARRIAEGDLGVHQFYSGEASNEEKIGATQKRAQFTVSEIIGFLNEFKTPAWVFERMFQQADMYYFKESELLQLETEVSDETKAQHDKAESLIFDLSAAFKTIRD